MSRRPERSTSAKASAADAQRPARVAQVRAVQRVVGSRQQHQGLRVLAEPAASVEEGPFHPRRERQVVGQQVGAGELAGAQLRR